MFFRGWNSIPPSLPTSPFKLYTLYPFSFYITAFPSVAFFPFIRLPLSLHTVLPFSFYKFPFPFKRLPLPLYTLPLSLSYPQWPLGKGRVLSGLLEWNRYFWLRFIFVCQKSLKRTFRTGFEKGNFIYNYIIWQQKLNSIYSNVIRCFILTPFLNLPYQPHLPSPLATFLYNIKWITKVCVQI